MEGERASIEGVRGRQIRPGVGVCRTIRECSGVPPILIQLCPAQAKDFAHGASGGWCILTILEMEKKKVDAHG
jgi:hypothetical protein